MHFYIIFLKVFERMQKKKYNLHKLNKFPYNAIYDQFRDTGFF